MFYRIATVLNINFGPVLLRVATSYSQLHESITIYTHRQTSLLSSITTYSYIWQQYQLDIPGRMLLESHNQNITHACMHANLKKQIMYMHVYSQQLYIYTFFFLLEFIGPHIVCLQETQLRTSSSVCVQKQFVLVLLFRRFYYIHPIHHKYSPLFCNESTMSARQLTSVQLTSYKHPTNH